MDKARKCRRITTRRVTSMDYGHLERKLPSLNGQKSTPNLKFLVTAKSIFFCLPHQSQFSDFSHLWLYWVSVRWVSVVEFLGGALCTGKVFGQESTVVKWNYQILSLHLVTVCLKVPILGFQSEFSMSKIIWIFSLKNINLGALFL